MTQYDVPVLIAGAGGAGLTASMLLSDLGIDSLAISSAPGTSVLPKAHVVQQRSMEIYRRLGVADDIYTKGTPPENMARTGWYAGLQGDHEIYGREIAVQESWGAGYTDPAWIAASPCRQTNLPQIRLEPVLLEHALKKNPGGVKFNQELIDFVQDDDGVTSTIRDRETDETYTVRSQYPLGADGGRMVGNHLGIEMQGERNILYSVSIHFTADLSQYMNDDPSVLIRWMWPAHSGLLTLLVPMGPEKWGRDSEEWVFHLNYATEDKRVFDDEAMIADMKHALGLPDFEPEIHKITRWTFEALVAERFQEHRTFLLGDAAHRHGPTGGLGLNTAIQDADNLTWKIAQVLKGQASPALLNTYEPERQPVAARNVRRSTENAMNHINIGAMLGVSPTQSEKENIASLQRLWSDDPTDKEYKARVRFAIASQSMEFSEHNVEFGYHYDSSAIVAIGEIPPPNPDEMRLYQPGTVPGSPVPHAWLDGPDGERKAIVDLLVPGEYLLLAGEDGAAWVAGAQQVASQLNVPINAYTIGHVSGDLLDPRSAWVNQRGHGPAGVVLIRPDGFVAWRSQDLPAAGTTAEALTGVLTQLSHRNADLTPATQ
ncbi:FAD-dependent monooxygenase [Enteractinococcus helveticum]|uniref:FAD-binding monooxygenase n=1 Tax=Enteractinococcus helveticum TaxID=1837282 RepID=A0A1B7M0T4_9MICC|nr:FAD-dependent monooxygenase [Enteractinococcus helveticum]OAV61810.1 FAD-binding monooxygenase [Enteractinococcus helveticum]